MNQALQGLKVLDLTRVLVGPYCTMLMADLGAEVLKLEAPGVGDDSRQFGPHANGESAYFMSLNRNKRSITINLKHPKGKELFKRLLLKADVLVENYRPGTMEKLGLGYEDLRQLKPDLIYVAASGFGHSGPYSKRAAYDAVVQAMGGIMSITGARGGKPTRVGPSIGDITAGLFAAVGLLAALHHRTRTGEGQKVDVAMLDCQVAILENAIARFVVTGEVPGPAGNRHASITPFEPFETSDGEIMIAAGNDALWEALCKALNAPELLADPRFKTNPLRTAHVDTLVPLLTAVTKTRSTAEWQVILDRAGVPNGPINTVDKVLADPQVQARDMIVEVEHPTAGRLKIPGTPIKLSATPGGVRFPSPTLGQHNQEVLCGELGLSEEELAALHADGVI